MLCGEFVDPQPAYVHAHGKGRRRLSPYEPQGGVANIGILHIDPPLQNVTQEARETSFHGIHSSW